MEVKENKKEEYAKILDRIGKKGNLIYQSVGSKYYTFLSLTIKEGVHVQPYEIVYIGEGKRDKIHHINGEIKPEEVNKDCKLCPIYRK